jgi:recombination protein RecT
MNTAVEQKKPNPMIALRRDLEVMAPEFQAALPPQISIESFQRVILTALQTTVGLSACKPKSIWNACMRAATDGLIPDGREGAIIPFNGEASWLPMVGGLKKKIFQSGKVATLRCEVVRTKDTFDHEEGDKPYISHKKYMGADDPGAIIAVYSIATMKGGGEVSMEIMSIWEVEQVRKSSRGTNTPWNNPIFYPEMVKKTCVKRHYKSLPQSKDVVEFFEHDDVGDDVIPPTRPERPKPSDFTDVPMDEPFDKDTGELPKKSADKKADTKSDEVGTSASSLAPADTGGPEQSAAGATPTQEAFDAGLAHAQAGEGLRTMPAKYRSHIETNKAFEDGFYSFKAET